MLHRMTIPSVTAEAAPSLTNVGAGVSNELRHVTPCHYFDLLAVIRGLV